MSESCREDDDGRVARSSIWLASLVPTAWHNLKAKRGSAIVISRAIAAVLAATVSLTLSSKLLAGGDWPDSPNKSWFEKLQRPDNHLNPQRRVDPKSLFCCGVADTVKTKFKVEPGNERYPHDQWYAWLKEEWVQVPPEKIVQDYAPDGQPYLFLLAGTIQCFVRPRGGL